jgi:branched-chain amino acid aminotransferase
VGRGSALFEVMDIIETKNGAAFFRAEAHIARLMSSAEKMHMRLPYTDKEIVAGMADLARASKLSRGAIKVLAYYCNPEFGVIPKDKTISVAAFCYTLAGSVGMSYEDCILPVTAGISSVRKLNRNAFDPHAKVAGHYVNAFHATWEAIQKGYKQPIMLDESGIVTEGALCSLFMVKGGMLITSKPDSVLLGVTRDSVIRIAEKEGISFKEIDYTVPEILAADEVFVTGSIIRVQPIKSIDGKTIGDGKAGAVTTRIQAVMEEVYCGRDARFASWIEKL